MKCISCDSEISATFKHALAKNECPVCGNEILDEESLVLIKHIKKTLSNEAAIREETLHRLALTLISTYEISTEGLSEVEEDVVEKTEVIEKNKEVKKTKRKRKAKKEKTEVIKVAPKSTFQKVSEKIETNTDQEGLENLKEMDNMSSEERDRIMEEVVKERYNLVDSSYVGDFEPVEGSIFSEGAERPVLERERQMRLAKQQSVLEGGAGGSFRRRS